MTIKDLAQQTVNAMLDYGLEQHSVWSTYCSGMVPLIKLHEEHGKEGFDRDIVTEYVRGLAERVDSKKISANTISQSFK